MNIIHKYPTSSNFIKNEVKTLEFIISRGLLNKYVDLNSTIQNLYYQYNAKLKKESKFDFLLHANFKMEIEGHNHEVVIGANVLNDFSICSYFLAIAGKNDDEKKLIRKFHFDYALPTIATLQKVPIFHLQYGGKASPEMGNLGLCGDKLDGWLSLPRLNFAPINLALLLDTLLCEFRTVSTNEIVESSEWRSLIYHNESFLLSSYFENIAAHIKSSKFNKNSLVRDFYYGS